MPFPVQDVNCSLLITVCPNQKCEDCSHGIIPRFWSRLLIFILLYLTTSKEIISLSILILCFMNLRLVLSFKIKMWIDTLLCVTRKTIWYSHLIQNIEWDFDVAITQVFAGRYPVGYILQYRLYNYTPSSKSCSYLSSKDNIGSSSAASSCFCRKYERTAWLNTTKHITGTPPANVTFFVRKSHDVSMCTQKPLIHKTKHCVWKNFI